MPKDFGRKNNKPVDFFAGTSRALAEVSHVLTQDTSPESTGSYMAEMIALYEYSPDSLIIQTAHLEVDQDIFWSVKSIDDDLIRVVQLKDVIKCLEGLRFNIFATEELRGGAERLIDDYYLNGEIKLRGSQIKSDIDIQVDKHPNSSQHLFRSRIVQYKHGEIKSKSIAIEKRDLEPDVTLGALDVNRMDGDFNKFISNWKYT